MVAGGSWRRRPFRPRRRRPRQRRPLSGSSWTASGRPTRRWRPSSVSTGRARSRPRSRPSAARWPMRSSWPPPRPAASALEADASAAGWQTSGASAERLDPLETTRLATRPDVAALIVGTGDPPTADERDLVAELVALAAAVAERRPGVPVILVGAAAAHAAAFPLATDVVAVPRPHGDAATDLRALLAARRAGPADARQALVAATATLAEVLDLRVELLEVGMSGALRARAEPGSEPGAAARIAAIEAPVGRPRPRRRRRRPRSRRGVGDPWPRPGPPPRSAGRAAPGPLGRPRRGRRAPPRGGPPSRARAAHGEHRGARRPATRSRRPRRRRLVVDPGARRRARAGGRDPPTRRRPGGARFGPPPGPPGDDRGRRRADPRRRRPRSRTPSFPSARWRSPAAFAPDARPGTSA